MASNHPVTLEGSLDNTEADASATLKAAGSLMVPLRRLRTAAQTGDLREIQSSIQAAKQALIKLEQQFEETQKGWSFKTQEYLSTGQYAAEVMATAKKMGLQMFKREDRLYCYPTFVRVVPSEKVVAINRKQERRIRPTVLVNRLKLMQERPPIVRLETFLSSLYKAYTKVIGDRDEQFRASAPVVPLVELYELFTLLPNQAKEYSKQEFARDIYLLHRSNFDTTKSGAKVSFPISRGARGKVLTVIDESGEERRYYGLRFVQMAT